LGWQSGQRQEAPPCCLSCEDDAATRQAHWAFLHLGEAAHRPLASQRRYERTAVLFGWHFTSADLDDQLATR
jgi:hypothetical protein